MRRSVYYHDQTAEVLTGRLEVKPIDGLTISIYRSGSVAPSDCALVVVPVSFDSPATLTGSDACRYISYTPSAPSCRAAETAVSQASSTPGFLEAHFSAGRYYDTVYVTANPMHSVDEWCTVELDTVFHSVINVWETESTGPSEQCRQRSVGPPHTPRATDRTARERPRSRALHRSISRSNRQRNV